MSSVFISNVDDYLAPSQACVNPIFAESTNAHEKKEPIEERKEPVVIPRKRRNVRRRPLATAPVVEKSTSSAPAKVSMADCLACSGCVTTAETVLVEQHSLATLRIMLAEHDGPIAITISPASWADLLRALQLSRTDTTTIRRQLTTFWYMQLQKYRNAESSHVVVVVDGTLPLQWSLQEAALEFCHAYRQRSSSKEAVVVPLPTIAVSSTQSQRLDGTLITHPTSHEETHVPLLTSSCPALVCLVEKSSPRAVPHLASTKSPMAMAGAYLKEHQRRQQQQSSSSKLLHVAIMPCHDKKLEASRRDLAVANLSNENVPDVDLVLTTQEWLTLLEESCHTTNLTDNRAFVEALPLSHLTTSLKNLDINTENAAILLMAPSSCKMDDMEYDDDARSTEMASNYSFFALGSGGYADHVFRFASQELFGCHLIHVPWTPARTEQQQQQQRRNTQSARVAARKRSDFHQVTLYRHRDGSYSCSPQSEQCVPVLRFATAYGLQTIQRILQPFSSSSEYPAFDYVEAMACPSGCPNGGGQVRLDQQRETPTETRERVQETQQRMDEILSTVTDSDLVYQDVCVSGPFGDEAKQHLHTRFHVVPSMQHTMGATAGVAVRDMQW